MNHVDEMRPRLVIPSRTASVSVAMCTFNGESYLREQIDSILVQSRKVDEIIVSDDGSTDGTRRLLKEYEDKYPGVFKLYFRDVSFGTVDNFQFALEQCLGSIIFLCDQDDVWRLDKVEALVRCFENPRCLLVFTDGRLINSTGRPLGSNLWKRFGFTRLRQLLWQCSSAVACYDLLNNNNKVTGATVAMRKELLTHSLPIHLLPHGYWHDGWFAMHAAANGGLTFVPDMLIDYRIHPKQQVGIKLEVGSSRRLNITSQELIEYFRKRYPVQAKRVARLWMAQRIRRLFPHR